MSSYELCQYGIKLRKLGKRSQKYTKRSQKSAWNKSTKAQEE